VPYSGVVASFTDPGSDGTVADYTATINWGDGTSSAGTIQLNGTNPFLVKGSHTYSKVGKYTVTVHIVDVGGSTADASGTATVNGGTAPPPPGSGGNVFGLGASSDERIVPACPIPRSLDRSTVDVIMSDHGYTRRGTSVTNDEPPVSLLRRGGSSRLFMAWDDPMNGPNGEAWISSP